MSRAPQFRLQSAHDDDNAPTAQPSPAQDALIVHPLSMFNPAVSPTYGNAEWMLSAFLLQQQEVHELRRQQQQQQQQQQHHQQLEQAEPRLSLLDYTCDENVRAILGFLDGPSLCRARRVCRHFHALGDDDDFWLHLCRAEWAISPEQLRQSPESYQALYKFACQSLKLLIRDFFEEQCLTSMQKSFRIPRDAAMTIARRTFVA